MVYHFVTLTIQQTHTKHHTVICLIVHCHCERHSFNVVRRIRVVSSPFGCAMNSVSQSLPLMISTLLLFLPLPFVIFYFDVLFLTLHTFRITKSIDSHHPLQNAGLCVYVVISLSIAATRTQTHTHTPIPCSRFGQSCRARTFAAAFSNSRQCFCFDSLVFKMPFNYKMRFALTRSNAPIRIAQFSTPHRNTHTQHALFTSFLSFIVRISIHFALMFLAPLEFRFIY